MIFVIAAILGFVITGLLRLASVFLTAMGGNSRPPARKDFILVLFDASLVAVASGFAASSLWSLM